MDHGHGTVLRDRWWSQMTQLSSVVVNATVNATCTTRLGKCRAGPEAYRGRVGWGGVAWAKVGLGGMW